ncbi:MAG: hypothetical protein DDT36_01697 [Firmicutes bacterium]|nr:hypothetical protein [Bacillota bacterium]
MLAVGLLGSGAAVTTVAHADLPLTVEALITDKGKVKLGLSVAYANADQQGLATAEPTIVQTGPTSFVTLPTLIGEQAGQPMQLAALSQQEMKETDGAALPLVPLLAPLLLPTAGWVTGGAVAGAGIQAGSAVFHGTPIRQLGVQHVRTGAAAGATGAFFASLMGRAAFGARDFTRHMAGAAAGSGVWAISGQQRGAPHPPQAAPRVAAAPLPQTFFPRTFRHRHTGPLRLR